MSLKEPLITQVEGACPPLDGSELATALVILCQTSSEDGYYDQSLLVTRPRSPFNEFRWSPATGVLTYYDSGFSYIVAAAPWPQSQASRPWGSGIAFVIHSTAYLDGEDTGESLEIVPSWAPGAHTYLAERGWRLQDHAVTTEEGDAAVWLPPLSACETCPHFLACSLRI